MFSLKDDSFEFSKTQLKTELIDKKKLDNDYTQLRLNFTFDFKIGSFSKDVTWSNHDIESVASQLENLDISDDISAIEPDISFSYRKLEENLYTFYINFDNGIINSNMGTDSGISLRLVVNRHSLLNWKNELTKLLD